MKERNFLTGICITMLACLGFILWYLFIGWLVSDVLPLSGFKKMVNEIFGFMLFVAPIAILPLIAAWTNGEI